METWKRIPGWPAYEVSDWGRVRSYWTWGRGGPGRRGLRVIGSVPKLVRAHMASGRLVVTLGKGKSGTQKTFGVGMLVLTAFVRPPVRGEVARHMIDPTPWNCRLDNLAWGTTSENHGDTIRHNGKHFNSKLTPNQVVEIRALISEGRIMKKDIAAKYGISPSAISMIISGRSQRLAMRYISGLI